MLKEGKDEKGILELLEHHMMWVIRLFQTPLQN